MIKSIQTYYIIATTLLVAVLVYLFQRRGSTIRDLQMEKINKEMARQLNEIQQRVKSREVDYDSALQKYRNLRDVYNNLSRQRDQQ